MELDLPWEVFGADSETLGGLCQAGLLGRQGLGSGGDEWRVDRSNVSVAVEEIGARLRAELDRLRKSPEVARDHLLRLQLWDQHAVACRSAGRIEDIRPDLDRMVEQFGPLREEAAEELTVEFIVELCEAVGFDPSEWIDRIPPRRSDDERKAVFEAVRSFVAPDQLLWVGIDAAGGLDVDVRKDAGLDVEELAAATGVPAQWITLRRV